MKNVAFDWNDLKFFLAVARHGGLSAAGLALGTSASTVSRHIAALEERFGASLFLRQQTGYLLTDDGAALLKHIDLVEQAMMAAERNSLSSAQQELSGQVRLATTEMLAFHLIVPQLHRFRERYPKLQVELNIALTRANLSRREADLALRIVAPDPDDGAGDYIASRVGKMDFGMYVAAGSLPADAKAAAAWQSLDYVSWDDSWADLPMAKWMKTTFRDKPPALACNSLQAQYAAVRSGLGVGMLPCFIGDGDPTLQRLGGIQPSLSRDLWLVYHRDLKGSQRVIAMRDFIVELINERL
ncbi:LysR family transcriptional regulator [Herbaspirillum sp. ST 5-3]|uniref:LysR family transcriptional regulator n=1 Tax=Oxalobacteraceae TaxID=75682 RepID=UPI0010A3A1F3|nr:LysR family transcriptional regulator [Herbaspirillum sp. ST 5-3]